MSKQVQWRPRAGTLMGAAGMAMGFVSLVVVLGGYAIALPHSTRVKRGDIEPGAVTAKSLAHGSVHPKALAKGAVTPRAIRNGAVNVAALAEGSVTAPAIAPGSVGAFALGPVEVHAAALADPDPKTDLEWEKSGLVTASCGVGQRLLNGGVSIPALGSNQIAITSDFPAIATAPGTAPDGWFGQIVSNSGGGGAPPPQVVAVCLK